MSETPAIEIRPIEPDEWEAAVELVRKTLGEYDAYDFEANLSDLQPDRTEELYEEPKGRFWIAKTSDTIVGTAGLRREADRTCRLVRLSVHSDHRRSDVVQSLQAAFEEYAKQAGYRRVIAEATARQKPAANFLESAGFIEFKRTLRQKIVVVTFEKVL
ncbi:GNAT family N-acetyltransferase [Candidatus Sumerlaeota bacterium]|nr:GNAT family N-acetyltransferase [Candidatus Sumerlaeota bacterium]